MIISFEGPDAAGKSTQIEIAKNNLINNGHKVKVIHFPNYDSIFGKIIKNILNTDKLKCIDKLAFQYLYIADQINDTSSIKKAIDDGYVVLLDRYDLSSIVYAMAGVEDDFLNEVDAKRCNVGNKIYSAQSSLIRPDITFVFNLDYTLIEKRIKYLDGFESQRNFMKTICNLYSNIEDYIMPDRKIYHVNANDSIGNVTSYIQERLRENEFSNRVY